MDMNLCQSLSLHFARSGSSASSLVPIALVVGVARRDAARCRRVAVGVIVGDEEGEALAEAVGEELAVDVSRGVGDCVSVGLGVTLGDGLALAGSGSALAEVSVALDHKIGLYCGAVALRFGTGERQNAVSVPSRG